MARSKKTSLNVPNPLLDGIQLLQDKGIINYPSTNAAIVGLIRYALLKPGPHYITEAISHLHADQQDIIDDFLLEIAQRGHSLGRTFLRHAADRASQNLPEPDPETIQRTTAGQSLNLALRWQQGDETVWDEIAESHHRAG
jgi:hypothetical protein